MDCFRLCLSGLSLIGQSVLQLGFAGRLTGRRPRAWQFAAYLCMLCLIELTFSQLSLSGAALAASFGISACCCAAVLRRLSLAHFSVKALQPPSRPDRLTAEKPVQDHRPIGGGAGVPLFS